MLWTPWTLLSIKYSLSYLPHYTILRCPISKFRDPLNIYRSDEATLLKFRAYMEAGLFFHADHKLAPKWAWPGVRAEFRILWDPLNICGTDEATLFKFGAYMDSGLFLPTDHKLAPKWAWPGVRAQFRNFGTRSISVGRMKLRFSNLVCTWILGCSCPQTRNWPPSGRGLGNVPNFEISGPPQYVCIG